MSRIDRRLDRHANRIGGVEFGAVNNGCRIDTLEDSISDTDTEVDKHATRIRDVEQYVTANGCRIDGNIGLIDTLVDKVRINENDIARVGDTMSNRIERINDTIASYVECEECGCLLRKGTAVRGESVIEKKCGGFDYRFGLVVGMQDKESIREVYYCRVHAPKPSMCDGCGLSDGYCDEETVKICKELL